LIDWSGERASAIHDRMPVIPADRAAQRAWLNPDLGVEDVLALCALLPAHRSTLAPLCRAPSQQPTHST
jgi:putative SOS response-associated peptidase YedK